MASKERAQQEPKHIYSSAHYAFDKAELYTELLLGIDKTDFEGWTQNKKTTLALAEAAHEAGFHMRPEVRRIIRDHIARAYLNQLYQDNQVDKLSEEDYKAFFDAHPELKKAKDKVKYRYQCSEEELTASTERGIRTRLEKAVRNEDNSQSRSFTATELLNFGIPEPELEGLWVERGERIRWVTKSDGHLCAFVYLNDIPGLPVPMQMLKDKYKALVIGNKKSAVLEKLQHELQAKYPIEISNEEEQALKQRYGTSRTKGPPKPPESEAGHVGHAH